MIPVIRKRPRTNGGLLESLFEGSVNTAIVLDKDTASVNLVLDIVHINGHQILTAAVVHGPDNLAYADIHLLETNHDDELVEKIRECIEYTRSYVNINAVVADQEFLNETIVNELLSLGVRFGLRNGVIPSYTDPKSFIEQEYPWINGEDGYKVNAYVHDGVLIFTDQYNVLRPEVILEPIKRAQIAEHLARKLRKELGAKDEITQETCRAAAGIVSLRFLREVAC